MNPDSDKKRPFVDLEELRKQMNIPYTNTQKNLYKSILLLIKN